MPFDLITTIPIGFVIALAAKQLYTMIVDWLNQPTIVAQKVFESVVNNTVAIRNNVAEVAIFVIGGALEVLNKAKEMILHVIGGALQEVIRVLHLIVHIVKQGFIAVKNIYNIILASLETFYLALKTMNDFFWYIVEGTEVVVTTVATAPRRMYDFANTTITVFVEETVTPAVNWFLYGPKISYTRYYILVAVLVIGFSAWNWYKNRQQQKLRMKEKSA